MAATALVNFDFENVEMALRALDDAGLEPCVAVWAKLPDYESWRLILASDKFEQEYPLNGYRQISEALRHANIPIHRRPDILLLPMNSKMIAALRKIFGATKDIYGMRLGSQSFGDKYIEDAFVYRIR
jgi:hypothetical protein